MENVERTKQQKPTYANASAYSSTGLPSDFQPPFQQHKHQTLSSTTGRIHAPKIIDDIILNTAISQ